MAATLLRAAVPPAVAVSSAGTEPSGALEGVAEILGESGPIEFTPARTPLPTAGPPPDLLISVCEEGCAACPYVPGSREVRRWPLPDPEAVAGEERRALLRTIRDELVPMVDALAEELSLSPE